MNFEKAKEYIDKLNRFGSVLGLENVYELLRRLGNPQDKVKIIHVAGTNGKGSTIAYLSSILTKAGYKVGKYTSPVVFDYLEKYQINDINITEEQFVALVEKTEKAVEAMVAEGKGQPTIFEVETAMAYLLFYEMKCDIAIIETGLGGDMDATNVCHTVLASVIVSISLDHTGFLGQTLEEIAKHKAGIVKKGCPVVLYGQSEEVENVIIHHAKSLGAPLTKTDMSRMDQELYRGIDLSLKGAFGIKNACTAIEVVEVLRKQGYNISEEAMRQGLETATWHGRFETICREPYIIIDGAHNPGAVAELKSTLSVDYEDYKFVFIMGVLADKDFATEIEMIAYMAEKIITLTPDNHRALQATELADAVMNVNENVEVAASVADAVDKAVEVYNYMQGKKAIVAFGSLSYLGQLKRYVQTLY